MKFVYRYAMSPNKKTELARFLLEHGEFGFDDGPFLWFIGSNEYGMVFVCQIFVGNVVAIYSACTHRAYRRQGILRAAMRQIMARWRDQTLWIATEVNRADLVRFYEELGFKQQGLTKNVPYYGQIERNVVQLVRPPCSKSEKNETKSTTQANEKK